MSPGFPPLVSFDATGRPPFQEARRWRHARDHQVVLGGGAGRDRTDDLRLAKAALSQLSYSPG